MNWTASLAAAALAAGYVHYAVVSQLGGNPLPIVGWLVLFTATAGVALSRALRS